MIRIYEKILLEKRGSVTQWPKNKRIVLIVSGGLDSMVTSAKLMLEHKLEIYPLHIDRGQKNYTAEKKSLQYFSKYFSTILPNQFKPVKTLKISIPPIEIKHNLIKYMHRAGYPLRDPIMLSVGVQYAISLSDKTSNKIKTVFNAAVLEDPFPHCSLDSIRSINVAICQNLKDWEWVISAPNIDPFLNKKQIGKKEEVLWASKHAIPIEKTVSCYNTSSHIHCGICLACIRRKEAFKLANFKDNTEYLK